MVTMLETVSEALPSRRQQRALWHDATRYSPLLGCTICPDRKVCGGLQIENPIFNCLDLCCGSPGDCDAVCRNHPEKFARHVWEIGGFSFDNVPRAQLLAAPKLPRIMPVLFDRNRRRTPFEIFAVCLPLYKVISRHDGMSRYANARELADIRDKERKLVIKDLKSLVLYVQNNSNDEASILTSSGFSVKTPVKTAGLPVIAPVMKSLDYGALSGQVTALLKKVPGAKVYFLRFAPMTGGLPGSWTTVAVPNVNRKTTISGLTPGVTYAIQTQSLGSVGYSDWSDSATIMCV